MIKSYGWSETLQHGFAPYAGQGLSPGRVVVQQRGLYRLATEAGELEARLSGRLLHDAAQRQTPVAGDWVAADLRPDEGKATIRHVLPRRTAFVRRAAGPGGRAQVVAANVEVAVLVASLNADLNLRRLERYLASAYESGAQPIVALTKADLCSDVEGRVADVEAIACGVPIHAVSALTGEGMGGLCAHLTPGSTAVLLGSSGVGKSTLVNALSGTSRMATRGIREDDARGRHTTTHRELVLLASGAMILDTPGMRELGLWETEAGLSATFADIEALAARCRFKDCAHGSEPGCGVQTAIVNGDLDLARWRSFEKLQGELAHEARKEDPVARAAARKVWIARTKSVRSMMDRKARWDE